MRLWTQLDARIKLGKVQTHAINWLEPCCFCIVAQIIVDCKQCLDFEPSFSHKQLRKVIAGATRTEAACSRVEFVSGGAVIEFAAYLEDAYDEFEDFGMAHKIQCFGWNPALSKGNLHWLEIFLRLQLIN